MPLEPMCLSTAFYQHCQNLLLQFRFLTPGLYSVPEALCLPAMSAEENVLFYLKYSEADGFPWLSCNTGNLWQSRRMLITTAQFARIIC